MEYKAQVQGKPQVKTSKNQNQYLLIRTSGGKNVTLFGQTERWTTLDDGVHAIFEGDMKGDNLFQAKDFKLFIPTQEEKQVIEKQATDSEDRIDSRAAFHEAMNLAGAYISIGKDVDPNTTLGQLIIKGAKWGEGKL